MSRLCYLAYGSNLSSPRLRERAPSARALGTVELPGREVCFHKRSLDGSGKCDLVPSERPSASAWGVVWELTAADRARLDEVEGLGAGYRIATLDVEVAGRSLEAFTYLAEHAYVDERLAPYRWYLDFVIAGAEEHGFPAAYVRRLRRTPARYDPDAERAARNRAVLAAAASRR